MIRSLGVGFELIRHLEPLVKVNLRYLKLFNKLSSNVREENTSCMRTRKGGCILPTRSLLEVYNRQLRNYEQNPDQDEESIMEQITTLLGIANAQMILSISQDNCTVSLKSIIKKLEKNLSVKPAWGAYSEWLSEFLVGTISLPSSTPILFQRPLKPSWRNLLIKCIAVKHYIGAARIAVELCDYLLEDKSSNAALSSNDCTKKVIDTMEQLLGLFSIQSAEWLAIATFIWHNLVILREGDYLITRYGPIVDSLERVAKSELLWYLTYAYRDRLMNKEALSCCQESLAIRKYLPIVDTGKMLDQHILLICLYKKLGQIEFAITAAGKFFATLDLLEDKIKI